MRTDKKAQAHTWQCTLASNGESLAGISVLSINLQSRLVKTPKEVHSGERSWY